MEKDRSNIGIIRRMAAAGVNMVNSPSAVNAFATGGTARLTRDEGEELLRGLGAKVTKSVSAKTDYLIVGDKPSQSKIDKAKKLGVTIITEDELIAMLNEQAEQQAGA